MITKPERLPERVYTYGDREYILLLPWECDVERIIKDQSEPKLSGFGIQELEKGLGNDQMIFISIFETGTRRCHAGHVMLFNLDAAFPGIYVYVDPNFRGHGVGSWAAKTVMKYFSHKDNVRYFSEYGFIYKKDTQFDLILQAEGIHELKSYHAAYHALYEFGDLDLLKAFDSKYSSRYQHRFDAWKYPIDPFVESGVRGDEFWQYVNDRTGTKALFTKIGRLKKDIVLYGPAFHCNGWNFAIVLKSDRTYRLSGNNHETYRDTISNILKGTGSSYSYSPYSSSWICALRSEANNLPSADKERFTVEKSVYLPRDLYEVEAQSECDTYGRTDTYTVNGLYFKKRESPKYVH